MRESIVSGGVAGLVGGLIVAAAIVVTSGDAGRVRGPVEVYGSVDAEVHGSVDADISDSFKQLGTGFNWALPVTIQDDAVTVRGQSNFPGGSGPIQVEITNTPSVSVSNSGQFQAIPVYVAR